MCEYAILITSSWSYLYCFVITFPVLKCGEISRNLIFAVILRNMKINRCMWSYSCYKYGCRSLASRILSDHVSRWKWILLLGFIYPSTACLDSRSFFHWICNKILRFRFCLFFAEFILILEIKVNWNSLGSFQLVPLSVSLVLLSIDLFQNLYWHFLRELKWTFFFCCRMQYLQLI